MKAVIKIMTINIFVMIYSQTIDEFDINVGIKDNQAGGEFLLSVKDGKVVSIEINAVTKLFGGHTDYYPEISGPRYHNITASAFSGGFLRSGRKFDGAIGYGTYQIIINGNTVFVNFLDCEYQNGDSLGLSAFGTGYFDPDIIINFDSDSGFYKVKNPIKDVWRKLSEGDTINVWGDKGV